jgi:3-deoxy-D-manno-octulosonic-acid transferase
MFVTPMPGLYDILYGLLLGLSAPLWLLRPSWRARVFKALRLRGGSVPLRQGSTPAVLIHAVSLGEINATRSLVARLRELRPGLQFIMTTTTDTGFARGQQLYGDRADVILARYPLDFSRSVARFLDATRPSAVVLMELEVWPNFVKHCSRRGIPVLLVNGRLSRGSFRNYRLARLFVAPTFRRLSAVGAQDQTHAARFVSLGASADRVSVTGTMKFDTATVADRADGDAALAQAMGLGQDEALWVCGSTGPGEEQIVLGAYRKLLSSHPALRLAIIPRHPERFEEVATMVEQSGFGVLRRSNPQSKSHSPESRPVLLGDTMGELRKFYSLATVVFVGRSLVDLGSRQHGSDMIEPAALGKPVIVGPHTHNFADAMARFLAAGAMVQLKDESQLADAVGRIVESPQESQRLGRLAQEVVRKSQGATERHAQMVLSHLDATCPR